MATYILDNAALKFVIEGARQARKLTLRACETQIDRSFSIKLSLRYLIEDLNLFGTCDINDPAYLNEVKLKIFAEVLATTNLKNSLSIVRVCEGMYPSHSASEIFKE